MELERNYNDAIIQGSTVIGRFGDIIPRRIDDNRTGMQRELCILRVMKVYPRKKGQTKEDQMFNVITLHAKRYYAYYHELKNTDKYNFDDIFAKGNDFAEKLNDAQYNWLVDDPYLENPDNPFSKQIQLDLDNMNKRYQNHITHPDCPRISYNGATNPHIPLYSDIVEALNGPLPSNYRDYIIPYPSDDETEATRLMNGPKYEPK